MGFNKEKKKSWKDFWISIGKFFGKGFATGKWEFEIRFWFQEFYFILRLNFRI